MFNDDCFFVGDRSQMVLEKWKSNCCDMRIRIIVYRMENVAKKDWKIKIVQKTLITNVRNAQWNAILCFLSS